MKIIRAEFASCAVSRDQYPKDGLPEIALIGRSNVGKSSLINTFVNRKKLAKTSSTPGKTRTINFYRINDSFYLVDLPGFGYAKVPATVKRSWERMMADYMEGRKTLVGAMVILDPRRDAGDMEDFVYDWIKRMGIPVVTVFTKTDKLSRNKLSSRLAAIRRSVPIGEPVLFSSLSGAGRLALGKRIHHILAPSDGEGAEGSGQNSVAPA